MDSLTRIIPTFLVIAVFLMIATAGRNLLFAGAKFPHFA